MPRVKGHLKVMGHITDTEAEAVASRLERLFPDKRLLECLERISDVMQELEMTPAEACFVLATLITTAASHCRRLEVHLIRKGEDTDA